MRAINASLASVVVLMGCCCPLFWNPPNPPANAQPLNTFAGEKFAFIKQCVQNGQIFNVEMQGGGDDNRHFRDVPPEGAALIGFQAGLRPFLGDSNILDALRPNYMTRKGELLGAWIGKPPANPITTKARPGYIVGAVDLRTGLLMDGFALRFVRLEDGHLDVVDNYQGEWIGGQGGNPGTIGGSGVLTVGIYGRTDHEGIPCSLGLVAARLPN